MPAPGFFIIDDVYINTSYIIAIHKCDDGIRIRVDDKEIYDVIIKTNSPEDILNTMVRSLSTARTYGSVRFTSATNVSIHPCHRLELNPLNS